MDETELAAIKSAVDTPLVSLTTRQILSLVEFMEKATDDEFVAVGLSPSVRDL